MAQLPMSIDEAFRHFKKRIASADSLSFSEAENCAVASVGSAALRLIYDRRDETLTLEITHGLPGKEIFWLDLWQQSCSEKIIENNRDNPVNFESSIEYGLELMNPQ